MNEHLSREEIARLGETRPFWRFAVFQNGVTYSYPEDGDYTEKIDTTPIILNVIKKPKPKKETYISPFTGRVM